jgi:glycosyltransferase involved in cell wall biosynthesis
MAASERTAPSFQLRSPAMVGIALLTLVPGALGGSETYVRELLRALAAEGTLDYRVLVPPLAPDAGGGLPTTVATRYGRRDTMPGRLLAMTLAAARPGPLRAHLDGVSVVHYPLTLRIPATATPSVVTLLDLQHHDLPQLFSRAERAFRQVAYHRSVRGADRVIAISEFVRRRAIQVLGVDESRISAIPLALDHGLFTPGPLEREPFLLYPARPWPHKNHRRLYDAFGILRRERPELRLVLTGGGDFGALPAGVETLGLVSDDRLADLYRRASALVFPSLYEGFGQPPLEAMACGCPVACSNAASLPEVVGDAARLFDPHEPEEIAAAVRDVLDAPAAWAERGLKRAAGFSWAATAAATEAVYRDLL